jgi:hypothetical protein
VDFASNDVIILILRALPPSVNLEVALVGFKQPFVHRQQGQNASHVCDAITAILPRLEIRRIQLPQICPHVFDINCPVPSKLRHASLWLNEERNDDLYTTHCSVGGKWPPGLFAVNMYEAHTENNYFPVLESLSILSKTAVSWNREIVSQTTLKFPSVEVIEGDQLQGELLYFRDAQDRPWMVNQSQLANLLETLPWKTLPNHSRILSATAGTLSFQERCEMYASPLTQLQQQTIIAPDGGWGSMDDPTEDPVPIAQLAMRKVEIEKRLRLTFERGVDEDW